MTLTGVPIYNDPPIYTLEEFGRDLEAEIDKGYDPERIGDWARHMVNSRVLKRDKPYSLFMLAHDVDLFAAIPELGRTERHLRLYAKLFQKGIYEGVFDRSPDKE